MENGRVIENLFQQKCNDQYIGRNIGFKLFYDRIVTFDVNFKLDYHTFFGVKCSIATLCEVYSNYR